MFAGLSLALEPAAAQDWRSIPGTASDIGAGSGGAVWIIGHDPGQADHAIWRWTGHRWENVPGRAVRIDVDPEGNPVIVNSLGQIYRRAGSQWLRLPGSATDVGFGAGGALWSIGTNVVPGGFGIHRWNGGGWDAVAGGAVRIDVDPEGHAWVVTNAQAIYRFTAAGFVRMPGAARDIGIGADGSVFITAPDDRVFKWNGLDAWVQLDGGLVGITAGPRGHPWGVRRDHAIVAGSNASVMPPALLEAARRQFEQVRAAAGALRQDVVYNAHPARFAVYTVLAPRPAGWQPVAQGCLPPATYARKHFAPDQGAGPRAVEVVFEVKAGPGCNGETVCVAGSERPYVAGEFPILRADGGTCGVDWMRLDGRSTGEEMDVYRARFLPD